MFFKSESNQNTKTNNFKIQILFKSETIFLY